MRKYHRPYYSICVRRWTDAAKQCFLRGCVCRGANLTPRICENYEVLGDTCKMKATVIELVRRYGVPKGVVEQTVINDTHLSPSSRVERTVIDEKGN